jgi:peptidoglycan/xylan/chitin deacetylase (PgdA/CDA1 family)
MIGRVLIGALARSGPRTPLSVLIFHRVLSEADPLDLGDPDARRFEDVLRWITAWFDVIPLADAVAGLRTGRLPARPLAITFDDGYADNHDIALPILRRLGCHATFFVSTGFLDGGCMWNDRVIEALRGAPGSTLDLSDLGLGRHRIGSIALRRAAITDLLPKLKYLEPTERQVTVDGIAEKAQSGRPGHLMMTSDQVRALAAAGMTIGAHTVNHPILARLNDAEARREMAESQEHLEGLLREPVRLFAYPNGKPEQDYGANHVAMARSLGFDAAVSTAWGAATSADDLFQIPRFTPWDRRRSGFLMRLAHNIAARHPDQARERVARKAAEAAELARG